MKKLIYASLLAIALASGQAEVDRTTTPSGHPQVDRIAPPSGQTQVDTDTPPIQHPQVDRTTEFKPAYHVVKAYVFEVDTDEWYGYAADFVGHAVYGFEIFDEINEGDRVRVNVCDNGTPLIRYDDYVTQVHYDWH